MTATTSNHPAAQVAEFTAALFEPADLMEVRLLPAGAQEYVRAETLVAHVHDLIEQNAAGQNVYIGANPRNGRGGTAKDVALARCLFVDIDNITVPQAVERLEDSGLPWPTAVVSSGHGLHAYWRLLERVTDLAKWRQAQQQLIRLLDADAAIHDAPRIMRLPGFTNHKEPAAPCELLCTIDERCALAQLAEPAPPATEAAPSPGLPTSEPARDERERLKRYWLGRAVDRSEQGKRNETGLWLACQLRDAGIPEEEAVATLEGYADHQADDYTAEEAAASARSAYSRPAREPAAVRVAADADDGGADPAILPLTDGDDLPEIPPTVLPEWAARYASELSEAKEVSPTLATLLMLPVIASTCQRLYVVEVEGSYAEPLCLYASPALDSGERKTAIHGPIVKPIREFQGQLRQDAGDAAAEAEVKRRLAEKQIKGMEKQVDEVRAMGDTAEVERLEKEIIRLTLTAPKPGGLPQLVMQDFTDAALGVALSENGESLLVTSDEGGLFDNLAGRFSDVAEIDLFLNAHTGGAHTVNRTGRDNVVLERPLLSVAVSPQPGVLAKLGAKPGFSDRGLLARFLWALPRSSVGRRALEPAQIPAAVKELYHSRLTILAQRGHGREAVEPTSLRLCPDAYGLWKAFERWLEPRIGSAGDLRSIKPWASKLAGAVARIAAVCHVAERAGPPLTDWEITANQMQRAIDTGHLLIPHALAAHRLMLGDGRTVAADVVQHFDRQGWPHETQSKSDWWRQVRRLVGESSAAFDPVAQVLLDHGYLIEVESPGGYGTGRRGRYFRANRRLWAARPG